MQPAFSGQTVDDANGECARLRLVCTVIARQPSEQYPLDVVMGQQPAPGAHVREGRAVSLIANFIAAVIRRYVAKHPADAEGQVHVGMVRLEIDAEKSAN